MSAGRQSDDDEVGVPPSLSLWHRILLALPRFGRDNQKPPLTQRFREAVVKPVDPATAAKSKDRERPPTVEELRAEVKAIDDKERVVGLIAAPLAAVITIVVIANLIADVPAARLKDGALIPRHVSVGIYHELAVVLVVLTVLMLVMTMLRKRMIIGIAMALFGLAVFDLHGWGFGIPYILGGSWFLVRAYRAQRDLGEATGTRPSRSSARRAQGRGRGAVDQSRPTPNKRYTPPRKSPPTKPENEQRAG
jgi:hypothetical protein